MEGLAALSALPFEHKRKESAEFDLDLGVVHVKGRIDVVAGMVIGIKAGSFKFSFDEGLRLEIRLILAKGEIRFHIKNRRELWADVKLKLVLGGGLSESIEIISW
ncbi:hypothetical protein AAE478_007242 [Parahypoxylon ruwenzoriense]